MGPEQGPREGEENFVQDMEKAEAMAIGESRGRETAIELRNTATEIRELAARHKNVPLIETDLTTLAEKYETIAKSQDQEAEEDGRTMGNSYDYLKSKGKL